MVAFPIQLAVGFRTAKRKGLALDFRIILRHDVCQAPVPSAKIASPRTQRILRNTLPAEVDSSNLLQINAFHVGRGLATTLCDCVPQKGEINMANDRFNSPTKSEGHASAATPRPELDPKYIAMPLGFLIAALLFALACSKHAGPSNSSISSPGSTIQSPAQPPAVIPSVAAASVQAPAKRKVVKRRPSTATYADSTYGVSFRYPRNYKIKAGESAKPEASPAIPLNFVQADAVTLAAVELPRNSFPGSDFATGMFTVSVSQGHTAGECSQFAVPDTDEHSGEPLLPSEAKVGGRVFEEMDHYSGPAQPTDTKYYHVYENGMCYEFALGFSRHDFPKDVTPVDREEVFAKLEKILLSVRLESATAQPVVAAGKTATAETANTATGNNR